MNKRLIAIVLASLLVFVQGFIAYADPSKDSEQLIKINDKYQTTKQEVTELENDIFKLNSDISNIKQAIQANSNEVASLEETITKTKISIDSTKEELKSKQGQYESKMRHLYKIGGQASYLYILLDSASFSDFISKFKALSRLMDLDKNTIAGYNSKKKELNSYIAELDMKLQDVKNLKNENESKLAALEEKKSYQNTLLNDINDKLKELEELQASQNPPLKPDTLTPKEDVAQGEDTKKEPPKNEEDDKKEPPKEEEDIKTPEAGSENGLVSLGVFKLTGYCPCEICSGKWANGPTSTGTMPKADHTISVDPKILPFGSVVIINGKEYVAEDSGGGVKNYHIDIFYNTHAEALASSVKYAEVFMKK